MDSNIAIHININFERDINKMTLSKDVTVQEEKFIIEGELK